MNSVSNPITTEFPSNCIRIQFLSHVYIPRTCMCSQSLHHLLLLISATSHRIRLQTDLQRHHRSRTHLIHHVAIFWNNAVVHFEEFRRRSSLEMIHGHGRHDKTTRNDIVKNGSHRPFLDRMRLDDATRTLLERSSGSRFLLHEKVGIRHSFVGIARTRQTDARKRRRLDKSPHNRNGIRSTKRHGHERFRPIQLPGVHAQQSGSHLHILDISKARRLQVDQRKSRSFDRHGDVSERFVQSRREDADGPLVHVLEQLSRYGIRVFDQFEISR
mmetsp:Transcript_25046/g.54153  ORF Transcript_25046/g.54153 Transcript_25046/m.54153 type:complete len:272 (+) Transcript_25046:1167-1982(+)